MEFVLAFPLALAGFAGVFWGVSMVWLAIKAIFRKELFTLRKTIVWASDNPERAAQPKTKFRIALAVPAYLTAVFYAANEGLYQYLDRVISGNPSYGDIYYLFTIAFIFYQYAGFLAYDGVPDKNCEE